MPFFVFLASSCLEAKSKSHDFMYRICHRCMLRNCLFELLTVQPRRSAFSLRERKEQRQRGRQWRWNWFLQILLCAFAAGSARTRASHASLSIIGRAWTREPFVIDDIKKIQRTNKEGSSISPSSASSHECQGSYSSLFHFCSPSSDMIGFIPSTLSNLTDVKSPYSMSGKPRSQEKSFCQKTWKSSFPFLFFFTPDEVSRGRNLTRFPFPGFFYFVRARFFFTALLWLSLFPGASWRVDSAVCMEYAGISASTQHTHTHTHTHTHIQSSLTLSQFPEQAQRHESVRHE